MRETPNPYMDHTLDGLHEILPVLMDDYRAPTTRSARTRALRAIKLHCAACDAKDGTLEIAR